MGTKSPVRKIIEEPRRHPNPIKIDAPLHPAKKPTEVPSIPLPSKDPVPVGEE